MTLWLGLAAALLAGVDAWQQRRALKALTPSAVDIGFAQSMSAHHQQAVMMAQFMLDGRPTPLRGRAQAIAGTQTLETGRMQGWLLLWDRPLLPVTAGMGWMLVGHAPPDEALKAYLLDCQKSGGMPGQPTVTELDRLRRLDGVARDRLFVTLMLRHHEGALPMARFAATNATMSPVRNLAANIVREQAEELVLLRRTLAAMPPSP